jgi:pyridoxine 5-phosphate synthase
VSLFIAPDAAQIEAGVAIGAPVVEIHTGAWCDAVAAGEASAETEWQRICRGAERAHALGLEVHAGHGLNYETAERIAARPQIVELNIGHFLVGDAIFVGFMNSIHTMRAAMDRGRLKASS